MNGLERGMPHSVQTCKKDEAERLRRFVFFLQIFDCPEAVSERVSRQARRSAMPWLRHASAYSSGRPSDVTSTSRSENAA